MFPIELDLNEASKALMDRTQRRISLLADIANGAKGIHAQVHAINQAIQVLQEIRDDIRELDEEGRNALSGFGRTYITHFGELDVAFTHFVNAMAPYQNVEAQS